MTLAAGIDAGMAPRDFHRRWPTLQPPLRPATEVVRQMAALLEPCSDPLLLMGVTPELATLPRTILAIDWSPAMIELAWPGDTNQRRAIEGDWKVMPLADAEVSGAMGDAVLTMLDWPRDAQMVLGELWRVVRPGGRIVLRCLATPEQPETMDGLRAALDADGMAFHEWRLRVNMAAAHADGTISISSDRLWQWHERCWADREALAQRHGWPAGALDEIHAYRGSAYLHSYPTRSAIMDLIHTDWPGSGRFVETSGYAGAALCPLLVLERS